MYCEVLIIGGGLSGLRLAHLLHGRGVDMRLIEARDRFGGRVLTEAEGGGYYDLGPAWFWDGQPRIAALIDQFKLKPFEQYAKGVLSFEDETGNVQRGRGFASMEGSYRLAGGLGALIRALADSIPNDRLHLSQPATELSRVNGQITVTCANGLTVAAKRVVLALPPRVAATLAFAPALPATAVAKMEGVATWMAGQAKAVALYDTPFWREAGLSGDAMSRHGPMVEIHDASPASGGPYALFGFIGIPATARRNDAALRQAIVAQFARIYGEKAATPRNLFVKDWASDPFTSTPMDQQPVYSHPTYGRPAAFRDLWDGDLILSGTETASQFGGYLEGALEAAETAAALVLRERV